MLGGGGESKSFKPSSRVSRMLLILVRVTDPFEKQVRAVGPLPQKNAHMHLYKFSYKRSIPQLHRNKEFPRQKVKIAKSVWETVLEALSILVLKPYMKCKRNATGNNVSGRRNLEVRGQERSHSCNLLFH